MTNHLTNARVAATPPQHQEDTHPTDTARLLRLWCERTASVAAAAAHHPQDEQGLFALQQQVEKALRARSKWDRQVDELIRWEASLIHHGEVPAAHCLICKRARLEAAELPIRVTTGGAL